MIHDTLQTESKVLPLVSIIIPFFNGQDYIAPCIESVLKQTYPNFEIICVDDGSTDRGPEIIRRMMLSEDRIQVITIENHGQGYARNLALRRAAGEYVLFLDADDSIEDITLDLCVTRAEKDRADFVVFDWLYYYPDSRTTKYVNKDVFFDCALLEGDACERLLMISPIFTVNKLYRRSFLLENGLFYGEGHIYEDNPFWVHAALCAQRVSLIHSPLYRVTVNKTSSTKTNHKSDFHSKSYVAAVEETVSLLLGDIRVTPYARYLIAKYFYERFCLYFRKRTPAEHRKMFLHGFIDALCALPLEDFRENKGLSFCIQHHVFTEKKYLLFSLRMVKDAYLTPARLKLKNISKAKLKRVAKKYLRKQENSYIRETCAALYADVILFVGFDFRYTGNSRYLFEAMMKQPPVGKRIFFATEDTLVPYQYRLKPDSDRFFRHLARARIVIFESWIPGRYVKRNDAKWIQLWHGTPLKRMLYDSPEERILQCNPAHKIAKYNDIKRWDVLIADNETSIDYFRTSFLLDPSKMLSCGYPRVHYLLSHKDDLLYRKRLKEMYGIPADKKMVLYLPTWRDYNYGIKDEDFDLEYLIDLKDLQKRLGDQYQIVYKDHSYLTKPELVDFLNFETAETQELLLAADVLVTDYSSVMFDALAIDLPLVLYCTDFDKFEASRGVYSQMWSDLRHFVCDNMDELVKRIENAETDVEYFRVKEIYACRPGDDRTLIEYIERQ